MQQPNTKDHYTYQDYLNWPDDERWEIINGVAYSMAPSPSMDHQRILIRLTAFFNDKLKENKCEFFIAPSDVILSADDVVQPDLFVVCDPRKITKNNVKGAPDLIIEILSPSTTLKDRREKRLLYEQSGVQEYLIINPIEKLVERYLLQDSGRYGANEIFEASETLAFKSLAGVEIELTDLFEGIGS